MTLAHSTQLVVQDYHQAVGYSQFMVPNFHIFRQDGDILLPAETTVHDKWLPDETIHVILQEAESLGQSQQEEAIGSGAVSQQEANCA